jgi:hypothetical protein
MNCSPARERSEVAGQRRCIQSALLVPRTDRVQYIYVRESRNRNHGRRPLPCPGGGRARQTPALRALRPEALTPPRSLTTTPNNMRLDSLSCLRLGRQDRIGAETCQKRARSEPHGLTGAPCGARMQSGSASRVLQLDLGFHHRRNARAVSAAFNNLRQAPACVDNWFFASLAVAIYHARRYRRAGSRRDRQERRCLFLFAQNGRCIRRPQVWGDVHHPKSPTTYTSAFRISKLDTGRPVF